jgi:hypothetical protein
MSNANSQHLTKGEIMIIRVRSPYHDLLIDLLKDHRFTEIEQKVFNAFLDADGLLTHRDLARIVFHEPPDRYLKNERILHQIRDAIKELQDHGIPIIACGRAEYYIGNNLDTVKGMIFHLEGQINLLQARVNMMKYYYERQIKPFEKLKNELRRSR